RGDIAAGPMDRVAMKHYHIARLSRCNRDIARLGDEPSDVFALHPSPTVDVRRVDHASLVATWHEHERSIHCSDFVQHNGDVHGLWFQHVIIKVPGREVLVPGKRIAIKGDLGVYLELMDIQRVTGN